MFGLLGERESVCVRVREREIERERDRQGERILFKDRQCAALQD